MSRTKTKLREHMRTLWQDHTLWTRMYIVSFAHQLPDLEVTASRLMLNQDHIGQVFTAELRKPEVGTAVTKLLKEHIGGAVVVLQAARAGEKTALQKAIDDWNRNGQEIADALFATLSPYIGSKDGLREMMQHHLDTTITEAVARLEKRYDDDVKAYDVVQRHILAMADALADALWMKGSTRCALCKKAHAKYHFMRGDIDTMTCNEACATAYWTERRRLIAADGGGGGGEITEDTLWKLFFSELQKTFAERVAGTSKSPNWRFEKMVLFGGAVDKRHRYWLISGDTGRRVIWWHYQKFEISWGYTSNELIPAGRLSIAAMYEDQTDREAPYLRDSDAYNQWRQEHLPEVAGRWAGDLLSFL